MKFLLTLIGLFMSYYLLAQAKVRLYDSNMPNATSHVDATREENTPVLYTYLVEDGKEAVLIIPGGGYAHVALGHEGHDVAQEFNRQGYHAFVLYYRLPKETTMSEKKIGPLQDAQRAMQLIREAYGISRVGVLGFSAGGHLAASLSNHYAEVKIANPKQTSLRPDFSILVYPVISMEDSITHKGSKMNLLGEMPSAADIHYFSLEQQVSTQTPPTFLVHAKDDQAVVLENTTHYKAALEKNNISNGMFLYETGGHGFGLVNKTDERAWAADMFQWLKTIIYK